ncbi:MAG: hypothetical protein SF053_06550 [Bacteroidia bacterium]|nr:hypothetical protein [Bacteroidia bacterium]
MQTIAENVILQAQEWTDDTADEVVEAALEDFADAQPYIFAYLSYIGEEDFNEDEADLILYLGFVVWRAMSAGHKVPEIAAEAIEQLESANRPLLETMADEPEAAIIQAVEDLARTHSQPHILTYLIQEIQDPYNDVRVLNKGIMFMFLKIMVDAVDQSVA